MKALAAFPLCAANALDKKKRGRQEQSTSGRERAGAGGATPPPSSPFTIALGTAGRREGSSWEPTQGKTLSAPCPASAQATPSARCGHRRAALLHEHRWGLAGCSEHHTGFPWDEREGDRSIRSQRAGLRHGISAAITQHSSGRRRPLPIAN